jgi:dipeptidyl-peptidase III
MGTSSHERFAGIEFLKYLARFAILRVLLEHEQLVNIALLTNKNDILITLNRDKIMEFGVPAIASFLIQLQVYKATADENGAKALYEKYSSLNRIPAFETLNKNSNFDSDEAWWLALRKIVMEKRQPRKVFVQPNTFIKGSSIEFKEYESTAEGLLMSFLDRAV